MFILTSVDDTLVTDMDKDTVDWQPNFDGTLQEPVVLPTKFPNFLVNGGSGIAVGMATNVPTYNLGEICNGILAVLLFSMLSFSAYAEDAVVLPEWDVQQSTDGMLANAAKGVERLEEIIAQGQEMLTKAHAEQDVTQIDCLNSLLVNAQGFLSVVQNGESNLKDAVSRHDKDAQQHHYKLVQLGVSKGNDISIRMMECSTGVVGVSGTTVQETVRVCKIEPCLAGESYYDPSHSGILGSSGSNSDEIELSGVEIDVDASPYL